MHRQVTDRAPDLQFDEVREIVLTRLRDISFSDEALEAIRNERSRYTKELIDGSIDAAKRSNLNSVSEVHVQFTSMYYRLKASYVNSFPNNIIGPLGWLLLGISMKLIIDTICSKPTSVFQAVLAYILGIIGLVMVARDNKKG